MIERHDLDKLLKEFKTNQTLHSKDDIEILSKISDYSEGDAEKILVAQISKASDPEILTCLIKILSKYNYETYIDILIDILLWKQKSPDNKESCLKVRLLIATLLGNVKDTKVVLPLMYVLNDKDENYKLRLSAAEALGRVGDKNAVISLIDILSNEEEKSVYVRESAAKALGMIGDARAVSPLLSILESKKSFLDKFTFLKERVIEAIGRMPSKDERTFRALRNSLEDESACVRIGAIEALSNMDDNRIIPLIEKMLYDKDEEVSLTAANALYNITDSRYMKRFLSDSQLLESCKEEIRFLMEEDKDG